MEGSRLNCTHNVGNRVQAMTATATATRTQKSADWLFTLAMQGRESVALAHRRRSGSCALTIPRGSASVYKSTSRRDKKMSTLPIRGKR